MLRAGFDLRRERPYRIADVLAAGDAGGGRAPAGAAAGLTAAAATGAAAGVVSAASGAVRRAIDVDAARSPGTTCTMR